MLFVNAQTEHKILNLQYLCCQQKSHYHEQLCFICLQPKCLARLLCCHCITTTHTQHPNIPLKTYLLNITQQQSYLYKNKTSNQPKNQFNYLFYFQQIQTLQNNFCKKLIQVEDRFRDSIRQAIAKVRNVAALYKDNIRKIIKLYIKKQNFVQSLANLIKTQQKSKINTLLQQLSNNFNIPNFEQQQTQTQQAKYLSLQQKLQLLNKSFSTQLAQVPQLPCLKPLSLCFTPPIFSTSYQPFKWDSLCKSPLYTINQNKIACFASSTSKQRFALFTLKIKQQDKRKVTWAVKVIKLAGWIALGICVRQVVMGSGFKFNYSMIGHGSYMISGNGYAWSHVESQVNSKFQSFLFQTGDTLVLQYDPPTGFLTINKVGAKPATYKLKIAPLSHGQELSPCVNMCSMGDEVQIVTVPTGVF